MGNIECCLGQSERTTRADKSLLHYLHGDTPLHENLSRYPTEGIVGTVQSTAVGGQRIGGSKESIAEALSPGEMAAQAAILRASANDKRIGTAGQRLRHDELVGRVEEALRSAGIEVPFGLRSASNAVLEKRLHELRKS